MHKKVKRLNLSFLISFSQKSGLSNLYRKLNNRGVDRRQPSMKDRHEIYSIFEDDLIKFSAKSGIDITEWLL